MTVLRYSHATGGIVDDIGLWPDGQQPDGYGACPDTSVAKGWTCDGGRFAPPPAPADDLLAYVQTRQAQLLETGRTFDVAPAGQLQVLVLCDGTSTTRADLALLTLSSQSASGTTTDWLDNNGVTTTLTVAQLVALATAVGVWVAATYAVRGAMLAGIGSGVVTSMVQIDAAYAAVG